MSRVTPHAHRPVGAPGQARWLGGVDLDPGAETTNGVGHSAIELTTSTAVSLRDDAPPAGDLVGFEVRAPAGGTDMLWVCLGAYSHARAWPVLPGETLERNVHMNRIASISLRATASDGSSAPVAAIKPRVYLEFDSHG